MGENGKKSKNSDDKKKTGVNTTKKSRLVKDGAVVEDAAGHGAGSATAKKDKPTAEKKSSDSRPAGRSRKSKRPNVGSNSAKSLDSTKSTKPTSTSSSSAKTVKSTTATSTSSSAKTAKSTAATSTSSSAASTVNYAEYDLDAGIARYIWWGLACLALLLAVGLAATQRFGSTDDSAANSSNQAANGAGPTTVDDTTAPADGIVANNDETPSSDSGPAGPVSELEASSVAALSAVALDERVNVAIDGDTATLTGSVTTEADKASAEKSVEAVDGVNNVVNDLEVDPEAKPPSTEETAPTSTDEPAETPVAEPEPAEPSYNG